MSCVTTMGCFDLQSAGNEITFYRHVILANVVNPF